MKSNEPSMVTLSEVEMYLCLLILGFDCGCNEDRIRFCKIYSDTESINI
jgi:hypothetical protein